MPYVPQDRMLQNRAADLLSTSHLVSATVAKVEAMNSDESFDGVWKEATALVPIPENVGRTKKPNPRFINKESIVYESLGQQLTNTPDELKAEMKRLYVTVVRHDIAEICRRSQTAI